VSGGRLPLALAILLLAGCVGPVDTAYGGLDPGSLNGFATIHRHWRERLALARLPCWDHRVDDQRILIFLEGAAGIDLQAIDRGIRRTINQWLALGDRQLVLVRRDGNISDWLIRRWLTELAAAPSSPEISKRRESLQRALLDPSPRLQPAKTGEVFGGAIAGIAPLTGGTLGGRLTGPAPPGMTTAAAIIDPRAQPLITIDGHAWAAAIPCYRNSRIVLVVNAIPLLDAALVDPQARAMATALTEDLLSFAPADGPPPTALLADLQTVPRTPPPGILATLFFTRPFALVSWQLLAVLLLHLWWRAGLWLGRTEDPPSDQVRDFDTHVRALGDQLRRLGDRETCRQLIARAVGEAGGELLPPTTPRKPA
jgi:hypothetical protein